MPIVILAFIFLVSCSGVERPPTGTLVAPSNALRQIEYDGFTLWLDCTKHGAVEFRYTLHHDTGHLKRYNQFFLDPQVPPECQQTSSKAYGKGYDRGHLVPANHLDQSALAIKATNSMTNILPQAANMNRGAWLLTEEIIECYRELDELRIIGGVIWGNNPADDYFVQSHGIKTPDAYWKVIIRGTGQEERAIAWLIPNSQFAIQKRLDAYLISIAKLERITGVKIPVANAVKPHKPKRSWVIPKGCDKG
jgi:endonuclease G